MTILQYFQQNKIEPGQIWLQSVALLKILFVFLYKLKLVLLIT